MMKVKKILALAVVFIAVATSSKAAYVYNDEANLLILSRNTTKPTYTITYDKDSWTNEDVNVTILSDKVIQIIGDGYTVGDDGKTIAFSLSENSSGTIRVRDENYNYQDISYDVTWIDKEAPVIVGAENGATYNTALSLDYTDNGEITNIFVDRYDDTFQLYTSDTFYDNVTYTFAPVTKSTITAWVQKHIRGTEKYKYYLNGTLYATTTDTQYTFTGLTQLTTYTVKVEALDRYDTVISSKSYSIKTTVFGGITISRSGDTETVTLTGLPSGTWAVTCHKWRYDNNSGTYKVEDATLSNDKSVATMKFSEHGGIAGRYIMHLYVNYIDSNGVNQSALHGGDIYVQTSYETIEENESIYNLTADGKYYIRVEDAAGNETEIDFTIAK